MLCCLLLRYQCSRTNEYFIAVSFLPEKCDCSSESSLSEASLRQAPLRSFESVSCMPRYPDAAGRDAYSQNSLENLLNS